MEIKEYIDMYKKKHGLSDRKLASMIGVGERALNKWRRGRIPKGDNLRLLLTAINVDIQDVTFPMKNKTIPQRIVSILEVRPCTAAELCRLIYQEEPGERNLASIYVHIHRAKLITPIRTSSLYDGKKERCRPAVLYSLEDAQ